MKKIISNQWGAQSKRFVFLLASMIGLADTAPAASDQCQYWLTTTTGWVCLSEPTMFARELPRCPTGKIWRVTQGDVQQLWECRS